MRNSRGRSRSTPGRIYRRTRRDREVLPQGEAGRLEEDLTPGQVEIVEQVSAPLLRVLPGLKRSSCNYDAHRDLGSSPSLPGEPGDLRDDHIPLEDVVSRLFGGAHRRGQPGRLARSQHVR